MKVCKEPKRINPRRIYDWDMLCDGKTRQVIPGVDFTCQTVSFRIAFYNACFDRNRRGRVTTRDGFLYITARPLNASRRKA